jgi:hypothetical protein
LNDSLDLTDNDIRALSNFPVLYRLKTLLLSNNRISKIDPELLTNYLPNLTTLVLTNNAIAELSDLQGLAGARFLEHLVLLDNPLTKKKYYRLYVIWRLPTVRVLDFTKVARKVCHPFRSHAKTGRRQKKKKSASFVLWKQHIDHQWQGLINVKGDQAINHRVSLIFILPPCYLSLQKHQNHLFDRESTKNDTQERQEAKKLFDGKAGPSALAESIAATKSTTSTFEPGEGVPLPLKSSVPTLTMSKEDQDKIKAALAKATTLDEISRLERALKEGKIPSDLKGQDQVQESPSRKKQRVDGGEQEEEEEEEDTPMA